MAVRPIRGYYFVCSGFDDWKIIQISCQLEDIDHTTRCLHNIRRTRNSEFLVEQKIMNVVFHWSGLPMNVGCSASTEAVSGGVP